MKEDIVDELLQQWGAEHPGMEVSALGIVVRVQLLGRQLQRQTAAALARHELKLWEYDVLSVLRRQGHPFEMPATEIARAAVLTTGAMTTRIDGLESRGLVRRRKSRSDGRSVNVRLTARGKKLVDVAIDTRLHDAEQALAGIPANDRRRLASGLRQLMLDADW
jgi:DNA-binding MarR family transcriptional regulator